MSFYLPQRSWAKVMFLQGSVILSTEGGGCLPQWMLGYHPPSRPPWEQTPPLEQTPPRDQTPPGPDPPWSRHPPGSRTTPPPESRRQHTVNERPVRILLECILVKEMHLLCNCMLAIDVHTNVHVPKTIDQHHTGKTSPPTECESTKEIVLPVQIDSI